MSEPKTNTPEEREDEKPLEGWVQLPILRGVFEIEPILNLLDIHGGRIIGGYARFCCSERDEPRKAQDCDLFPTGATDEECQKVYDALKAALLSAGLTVKAENNMSVTFDAEKAPAFKRCPTIQLIKPVEEGAVLTRGSVEDILANFDFTVVRCALNSDRRTATAWASFPKDELHMKLRILNIHCPISSLLRVMKYARKGYYMRPVEALKLFNDWEQRSPEYRARMNELFTTGQFGKITKEEIDELEKLMRID